MKKDIQLENGKNVFDLNPGVSNKIRSVTCLPIIENTFIPSSIETKGCSEKNTKFLIYGEWEDKDENQKFLFYQIFLWL